MNCWDSDSPILLAAPATRAFNPLSRDDIQLFKAMMAGQHHIREPSNASTRTCLEGSPHLRALVDNAKKQSAKVSRIVSRFHEHKLIAKTLHTRKRRAADRGKQIMPALLCFRDVAFPELFPRNAAAWFILQKNREITDKGSIHPLQSMQKELIFSELFV